MHTDDRFFRILMTSAIACITALLFTSTASAQMPTDPAEAMRYFEQETEVGEWDNGPVQYLFTREEREIWDDLEADEQRRDFVQWFWDRRDADLRDQQHPFREGFYTRVATANERFSGFPRGWRSDRGRVWIVLGRPDGIRASGLNSEVWIYNTYGGILKSSSYMGQMEVGFRQVEPAQWQIAGGVGPGAWPPYVLQAFDIINQALIQNPDLEWKGTRARP
jgi:GWxTD domain-containing protein